MNTPQEAAYMVSYLFQLVKLRVIEQLKFKKLVPKNS